MYVIPIKLATLHADTFSNFLVAMIFALFVGADLLRIDIFKRKATILVLQLTASIAIEGWR